MTEEKKTRRELEFLIDALFDKFKHKTKLNTWEYHKALEDYTNFNAQYTKITGKHYPHVRVARGKLRR